MINVAVQGLGPIGQQAAKEICRDKNMNLVGAIDINEKYVGKNIEELFGIEKSLVVIHADEADSFFKAEKPHVLVLTTSSYLKDIRHPVETAIKDGVNVVASSEEMFFSQLIDWSFHRDMDYHARKHHVRALGTGVNPGCLLDTYVVHLAKTEFIDAPFLIKAYRIDDTTERRTSLLDKTGAGYHPVAFPLMADRNEIGHVGTKMSMAYILSSLGLEYRYEDIKDGFKRKPVINNTGDELVTADGRIIREGYVAGLHEECDVIVGKTQVILELEMYVGATNMNRVEIWGAEGHKVFDHSNIVNGDIATVRILLDAIGKVADLNNPEGLNSIFYAPDPNVLLGNTSVT